MENKYSKKQLSQIIWHPRIFGIPTPNSLGNIEPPQEIRYPPNPYEIWYPCASFSSPFL